MSRGSVAQRAGHQRGAVLVEFALTLPVLILIVVGIFDFGRAFQEWVAVTNAAREGARMAVLPGAYTDDDITARVESVLRAGGIAAVPNVVVTPTTLTPDGGGVPFTTKQ